MKTTKDRVLDFDVIIVGAGLSGIGAAYHLKSKCKNLSFLIIEGRQSIGGTWDLFRYPGIRSDSDMYTFGFSFNPWKNEKSISDGASIMEYMNQTVDKFDLKKHIQLETRLTMASWNSLAQAWTLELVKPNGISQKLTCGFLFSCTGYYDYENGYRPKFPNEELFKGPIIHPQHWDSSLNYKGKKIVIIGSGATAVTLLPELAKEAEKVTMLQRSPTYIMNLPNRDKIASFLKRILPEYTAHQVIRWKNIMVNLAFYSACQKWPATMRKFMLGYIKKYLGTYYNEQNFLPRYDPWDQRLCVVPDNDLFDSLKSGKAEIVTDTISSFTSAGITTGSCKELQADIIITATGLILKPFGGAKILVDGKQVVNSQTHLYRGAMLSGVPNFVAAIGYTNASWTLKVDMVSHFVTRLLNYMQKKGYHSCTPVFDAEKFNSESMFDFDAGYILRGKDIMPKQGSKRPWKVYQNYIRDLFLIKRGNIQDGHLKYR